MDPACLVLFTRYLLFVFSVDSDLLPLTRLIVPGFINEVQALNPSGADPKCQVSLSPFTLLYSKGENHKLVLDFK